jgi:hypothetical protein
MVNFVVGSMLHLDLDFDVRSVDSIVSLTKDEE